MAKASAAAAQDRQERKAKQAELSRLPVAALPKVTPTTLWPEPDFYKVSRSVDMATAAGGPWRGANSLWQDGAVPNDSYTEWNLFYLYAAPGANGHPVLGTLVLSGHDAAQSRFVHRWVCPRAVGAITITAVTAPAPSSEPVPPHPYPMPAGIVQFTTSSGVSGTFDLAAQTWTFAS